VIVRERLRAAYGVEMAFFQRAQAAQSDPHLRFAFDPYISEVLSFPGTSQDELAQHGTDRVHPDALKPLALFFLGLLDDLSGLRPSKKFVLPGLYCIQTKDGRIIAKYTGASSAGAFEGSMALTGPHGRGLTHERHARSVNPPQMQVYISDDGMCNNEYDIVLLFGFHAHEIVIPPAGGLRLEDLNAWFAGVRLSFIQMRALLHIHEAAFMLALGTSQLPFMHPTLAEARSESTLASVLTNGLNRANGLNNFSGAAAWHESIGCAGSWFQILKGKRRREKSLQDLLDGWVAMHVRTYAHADTNGCVRMFSSLGVTQSVPLSFPEGPARLHMELDGPSPVLYLQSLVHPQQLAITRFTRSYLKTVKARFDGADDTETAERFDDAALRRSPLVAPIKALLDGQLFRPVLNGTRSSFLGIIRCVNLSVDKVLFAGESELRVQFFYRLPPDSSPKTAERRVRGPRFLVTGVSDPSRQQLMQQFNATLLSELEQEMESLGFDWRDYCELPLDCPAKLLAADFLHPIFDLAQLAQGPDAHIFDLLGCHLEVTMTARAGKTMAEFKAFGIQLRLQFPARERITGTFVAHMRLVFTAGRRAHLFVTPVSHPDAPTTAFTQRQLPIPLLNEVQARMQQHMLPMEWYIVDDDLALSDKGWKPPKQSKTPLGGTFVWSLPSPAVASSPADNSSPPSRASGSTASTSSEPVQNAVHVDDGVVHDQETDGIEGAELVYIAAHHSAHELPAHDPRSVRADALNVQSTIADHPEAAYYRGNIAEEVKGESFYVILMLKHSLDIRFQHLDGT
jgi:hypothetical protein